jgi:hypothetical protein
MGVAVGAVVVLGVLAFGCGGGGQPAPRATASPSVRATATPNPRVAQVEAAVRRYIEAVQASARTGNASGVDQLVVAGSQAEGNAGIVANLSRENHYNFIATSIHLDEAAWIVSLSRETASVTARYSLVGHLADWPSLTPRESDHETPAVQLQLGFELRDGKWLVNQSS